MIARKKPWIFSQSIKKYSVNEERKKVWTGNSPLFHHRERRPINTNMAAYFLKYFYLFSFCHDESSQGTEMPWLQLWKDKQQEQNFTNCFSPFSVKLLIHRLPWLPLRWASYSYLLSREPTVVAIAAGIFSYILSPLFLYCVYLALFSPLFSSGELTTWECVSEPGGHAVWRPPPFIHLILPMSDLCLRIDSHQELP